MDPALSQGEAIPRVVAVIFCHHHDALHGDRVALGEHDEPDVPLDVFVFNITVVVPPHVERPVGGPTNGDGPDTVRHITLIQCPKSTRVSLSSPSGDTRGEGGPRPAGTHHNHLSAADGYGAPHTDVVAPIPLARRRR